MASFTRPSTKAHREIWMTLDGDARKAVRDFAEEVVKAQPDLSVNDVWDRAFHAQANPVPDVEIIPDPEPEVPAAVEPSPDEARTRRSEGAKYRLERLANAEAESAAVKAWVEGGEVGPRPETPNLDSLNSSEPLVKVRAAQSAEPVELPALEDGILGITLRGKRSPGLVRDTLHGHKGLGCVDDHDRLQFEISTAQEIVDLLRARSVGASQYVGRCLNDTIIRIRHLAPTVTDPSGGTIAKAVDAVTAANVKWEPVTRSDASTVFDIAGYSEHLTARTVIQTLGAS